MGFNEFLSSIFGNKSTRDMKEIKPWVEKIKAAYPGLKHWTTMPSVPKRKNSKNTSANRLLTNALKWKNLKRASKAPNWKTAKKSLHK